MNYSAAKSAAFLFIAAYGMLQIMRSVKYLQKLDK